MSRNASALNTQMLSFLNGFSVPLSGAKNPERAANGRHQEKQEKEKSRQDLQEVLRISTGAPLPITVLEICPLFLHTIANSLHN